MNALPWPPMSQVARQRFSFDDYVSLEEMATAKHEYLAGEVWAMAGGSPQHAAISANVITLLSVALRGRACRVYSSDLRVRVTETGLGTYPDVSVVCGPPVLDPEDRRSATATNPTVLVEVLSPSTEDYDRGEKLGHYKRIPSLGEVVFVAHDRHEVEVVRREPDGTWSRHVESSGGLVRLVTLGVDLEVDEVYRDPTR